MSKHRREVIRNILNELRKLALYRVNPALAGLDSGGFGGVESDRSALDSKPYTPQDIDRLIAEVVADVQSQLISARGLLGGLPDVPPTVVRGIATSVEAMLLLPPSEVTSAGTGVDMIIQRVVRDRNFELRSFPNEILRGQQWRSVVLSLEADNTKRPGINGVTPEISESLRNVLGRDESFDAEAARFGAQLDIPAIIRLSISIQGDLDPTGLEPELDIFRNRTPLLLGTSSIELFRSMTSEDVAQEGSVVPAVLVPDAPPEVAQAGHDALVDLATLKVGEVFGKTKATALANQVIPALTGETRTEEKQFVRNKNDEVGIREWNAFSLTRADVVKAIVEFEDSQPDEMDLELKAEEIATAAEEAIVGFADKVQSDITLREDEANEARLEKLRGSQSLRKAEVVNQATRMGFNPADLSIIEHLKLEREILTGDPITADRFDLAIADSAEEKADEDLLAILKSQELTNTAAKDNVRIASDGQIKFDDLLDQDKLLVLMAVQDGRQLRKAEVLGFARNLRASEAKEAEVALDTEEETALRAAQEASDRLDSVREDNQDAIRTGFRPNAQEENAAVRALEAANAQLNAITTEATAEADEAEATRIAEVDQANQAAITRSEIIFLTRTLLGGTKEFQEYIDAGGTIDDLVFEAKTWLRNLLPGTDITAIVPDFIQSMLNYTVPGGVAGFEASFEDMMAREAAALDPSRIPGIPASAQRALVSEGLTPFPTLGSVGTITQEELFGMDFGTDTEIAQTALDLSKGDPFLQEYLISQAGTKEFEERFRAESQRRYQEAEDVFQARFAEVVDTSTGKVTPAPGQTTARGPTHAGLSKTDFLAQESGALTSQFDVQPSTVQRRQNEEERERVQAETEAERDREERERRSLRGSFSTFSRSA